MTFLLTQYRASRWAKLFNARLDGLEDEYTNAKSIPRVTFLDASIYQITDADNDSQKSMLVEERLETEWGKWNNNSGYVHSRDISNIRERKQYHISTRGPLGERRDRFKTEEFVPRLASIDEDEDEEENECKKYLSIHSHADVLQCFSHWSYNYTQRTKLVCDLQGT